MPWVYSCTCILIATSIDCVAALRRLFKKITRVRLGNGSRATAYALVGVFVIENHCGLGPVDHYRLAVHFLERDLFDRALTEARRAGREDSDNADAHVVSALAYLGLDRPADALTSLQLAIRARPDDPRLYATLREVGLQSDRIDLVRDALLELKSEFPDNWRLRVVLGWTYMRLHEDESAIELLTPAVADSTDLDRQERLFAHLQLSRIYMRGDRLEEATRVLAMALRANPAHLLLNLAMGECYLLQDRTDEADAHFVDAIRRDEEPARTAAHVARLYYDVGQIRRAIDYYELALTNGGDSPLVLNNLAWAYVQEGFELDRAARLSLRAVKMEADNVVYLDTYAELLYINGERNRAVALMERALALEPSSGEHYEYLQSQLVRFKAATPSGTAAARL